MYTAVILCGGESSRSELEYNKVFYRFYDKPLVVYAIERFRKDSECQKIVIASRKKDIELFQSFVALDITVIEGGMNRQESAKIALNHVQTPYVMIHDGSRGYFSMETLNRLKEGFKDYLSVSPAVPVIDTLKRVNKQGMIYEDVNRDQLYQIQTPQAFHTKFIKEAHQIDDNVEYPCDASLIKGRLNIETKIVLGDRKNLKLTTPEDLQLLELILL